MKFEKTIAILAISLLAAFWISCKTESPVTPASNKENPNDSIIPPVKDTIVYNHFSKISLTLTGRYSLIGIHSKEVYLYNGAIFSGYLLAIPVDPTNCIWKADSLFADSSYRYSSTGGQRDDDIWQNYKHSLRATSSSFGFTNVSYSIDDKYSATNHWGNEYGHSDIVGSITLDSIPLYSHSLDSAVFYLAGAALRERIKTVSAIITPNYGDQLKLLEFLWDSLPKPTLKIVLYK